MCSVLEGEPVPPTTTLAMGSLVGRSCMKCGARAVAVARTRDPFCKSCFLVYFTHRFRSTIGKSRLIRDGERVLLAFSGGICSRVLLAVIEEGLSERVKKRLKFLPTVVCIDEGAVMGKGQTERCQVQGQMIAIAAQLGFAVLFTRLEEVFGSIDAYSLEGHLKVGVAGIAEKGGAQRDTSAGRRKKRVSSDGVCLGRGGGEGTGDTSADLDLSPLTFLEAEWSQGGKSSSFSTGSPSPCSSPAATESSSASRDVASTPSEQTGSCGCAGAVVVETETSGVPDSDCAVGCSASDTAPHCDSETPPLQSSVPSSLARDDDPSLPVPPTIPAVSCEELCSSSLAISSAAIAEQLERFPRNEDAEQSLCDLFASGKSITAKENLLLSLRHRLLVEIARKHGFTKVLVGDSATRLAVRLLGNIAQGRGASLPLDTGFADDRFDDVTIVRPLREFPSREIATYAALNNLQTVAVSTLQTKIAAKGSIERLTESFINGLQANFPSTVHTIFRTGDKLTVSSDASDQSQTTCTLCQAPRGLPVDGSVYSHLNSHPPLSTAHTSPSTAAPTVPDRCDSPSAEARPDSSSSSSSSFTLSAKSFWDRLCYGCRLTVKDMDSAVSAFPPCSLSKLNKSSQREMMQDQIRDFLFEEEVANPTRDS